VTRKNIKAGDLIKVLDWKGSKPDDRIVGTVLQLSELELQTKTKYRKTQSLSEVLWQDGKIGWILTERLGIVGEEWKD